MCVSACCVCVCVCVHVCVRASCMCIHGCECVRMYVCSCVCVFFFTVLRSEQFNAALADKGRTLPPALPSPRAPRATEPATPSLHKALPVPKYSVGICCASPSPPAGPFLGESERRSPFPRPLPPLAFSSAPPRRVDSTPSLDKVRLTPSCDEVRTVTRMAARERERERERERARARARERGKGGLRIRD